MSSTLKILEILETAQIEQTKAKAIATAIESAVAEESNGAKLARNTDILEIKTWMREGFGRQETWMRETFARHESASLEKYGRLETVVNERFAEQQRWMRETFATKVELETVKAVLEVKVAETKAELMKWMFLFCVGQTAVLAGFIKLLLP